MFQPFCVLGVCVLGLLSVGQEVDKRKIAMSSSVDSQEYKLDGLKWLLVVAIVAVGVIGNAYYSEDVGLLYRVVAMVVMGLIATLVALQTARGAAFWALLKSAQIEMRKVVWPTKPETNQTTLLVLVVVFFMAILLWGLDALFGKIASFIIG